MLKEFQRMRERIPGGYLIHADGPIDDRTLCGYAYEGACTGEGDHGVEQVERGKVNCAFCLAIIWYCQSIPKRRLAQPEPERIKVSTRQRDDG